MRHQNDDESQIDVIQGIVGGEVRSCSKRTACRNDKNGNGSPAINSIRERRDDQTSGE